MHLNSHLAQDFITALIQIDSVICSVDIVFQESKTA